MASTVISLYKNTQQSETIGNMASANSFISAPTHSNIKSTLISTIYRIMDMVAIITPITSLITMFVLESVQPGYDRMRDTISALVWGQHGWSQTVVFYLFALVMAYLALRLYLFGNSRKDFRFGISLITLIAIGFIIIAVFPTKAPGTLLTLKALAHRQTARMICFLFPLACLLIASGLRVNSNWGKIRGFTLVTGGLGIVLFAIGALVTISESSWIGVLERVIMTNGLLWCEIMGIKLVFSESSLYRVWAKAKTMPFLPNIN